MTDYVNKINNIPIGGNIFDGLPTFVDATLSSGVDLGPSETFTSSLSSILPNDGQDYMCMFEVQSNNLSGVSSTNGYYEVTIHNSTTGDLNNNIWRVVTAGRYHNHGIGRVNSVWLPIFANNRNVTLMQRSTGTDRGARIGSFKLKQYYRLGSNGDSGNYIDNITTLDHNSPVGDETVSGNNSVTLEKAAANGLNSVTVTGKCERTVAPSPSNPIPIVSNNGELKVSKNLVKEVYAGGMSASKVYLLGSTPLSGSYTTTSDWKGICAIVPVVAGKTYIRSGSVTNAGYRYTSFYANYSDVRYATNALSTVTTTSFTAPSGANYAVVAWITETSGTTITYSNLQVELGSTATEYSPYGEVYADGITETITDSANNTATAEMLLAVDTYKDTQEILSGAVTRKVGVVVLDGTEDWGAYATNNGYRSFRVNNFLSAKTRDGACTHLPYYGFSSSAMDRECVAIGSNKTTFYINLAGEERTVNDLKTWLASQYSAGTPVIFIYPLATETTETVTGQTLTTITGDNTLTISQASIANLPIEVNYDKLGDVPINIPVGGEILAAKEVPINIEPEAAFAFTGSEYKTYDLSQQIPNDGYAYELLVQAFTRSNQNAYCRVYVGWVGADGNYKTAYLQNCGTDSNGSIAGANNQRVILQPNSRVIRFGNNSGSATGSCRFQVVSCKRLGTNE